MSDTPTEIEAAPPTDAPERPTDPILSAIADKRETVDGLRAKIKEARRDAARNMAVGSGAVQLDRLAREEEALRAELAALQAGDIQMPTTPDEAVSESAIPEGVVVDPTEAPVAAPETSPVTTPEPSETTVTDPPPAIEDIPSDAGETTRPRFGRN